MLLKDAQECLAEGMKEMRESRELVHMANQHLSDAQEENRKLKRIIWELTEIPAPEEVADLLDMLDHPCGFVNCTRSERAARCIRELIRQNEAIRKENERLKHGTD